MGKNSLLRPLTEAERATIVALLQEVVQARRVAKQAIAQHLSELEQQQRGQLCTEEQTRDSKI